MTDIYVIADCSGSFAELGKCDLQRLLLHTISGIGTTEEFDAFAFHLYTWSDRLLEYQDGKRLSAGGRGDPGAFLEFLKSLQAPSRILFMSDGAFGQTTSAIKREIKRRGDLFLVLAVGADADQEDLRKLTADQRVFRPSEIIAAMKTLCYAGE